MIRGKNGGLIAKIWVRLHQELNVIVLSLRGKFNEERIRNQGDAPLLEVVHEAGMPVI